MKHSTLNQIRKANKFQGVSKNVMTDEGFGVQITIDGDIVKIYDEEHIVPDRWNAMRRYEEISRLVNETALNISV